MDMIRLCLDCVLVVSCFNALYVSYVKRTVMMFRNNRLEQRVIYIHTCLLSFLQYRRLFEDSSTNKTYKHKNLHVQAP